MADDSPPPFTAEQEARIRALFAEEIKAAGMAAPLFSNAYADAVHRSLGDAIYRRGPVR